MIDVDKKDLNQVIQTLEEKKCENHFILRYLKNIKAELDYKLLKFDDLYAFIIKDLLITLSYSDHHSPELFSYLKSASFHLLIAPNMEVKKLDEIESSSRRSETLMKLERGKGERNSCCKVLKTISEYTSLFPFYDSIDEFERSYSIRDLIEKYNERDEKHFVSVYMKNNEIISSLIVNDGLIASVATRKDERRKGYARINVLNAASYYFDKTDEDEIYLFYNNEKAGDLYRSIGFKEVSDFTILKRSQRN